MEYTCFGWICVEIGVVISVFISDMERLLLVLILCAVSCSLTNAQYCLSSVEEEINGVFRWCKEEKECSESITSRLTHCFPKAWMTVVWTPIVDSSIGCYYCSQQPPCGCYTGTNGRYEYQVASSNCREIRDIPNILTRRFGACMVTKFLRFVYYRRNQAICSAGAMRYKAIPNQYSGIHISGSKDMGKCLTSRTASNDDIYLWAFG